MNKVKHHHPLCSAEGLPISPKDCAVCKHFHKVFPVRRGETREAARKRIDRSSKKVVIERDNNSNTWDIDKMAKQITCKEEIAYKYEVTVEAIEFYHEKHGENPRYYTIDVSEEPKIREELFMIERRLKVEKIKNKIL